MILRDVDITIEDLVSLEDLKTEMLGMGMAPEDYGDDVLRNRISTFSEKIVQVCGQFFDKRDLAILHSGSGRKILPLKFPLVPGSTVKVEEYDSSDNSWVTVESSKYTICWNRLTRIDVETQVISSRPYATEDVPQVWEPGSNNYRVTSKFGYKEIPAAIKQVLIVLILSDLDPEYSRQTLDLESEKTDKYSYKRFPVKSNVPVLTGNDEADRLLHPYVYRPPEDRLSFYALGKRKPSTAGI